MGRKPQWSLLCDRSSSNLLIADNAESIVGPGAEDLCAAVDELGRFGEIYPPHHLGHPHHSAVL